MRKLFVIFCFFSFLVVIISISDDFKKKQALLLEIQDTSECPEYLDSWFWTPLSFELENANSFSLDFTNKKKCFLKDGISHDLSLLDILLPPPELACMRHYS